MSTEPRFGETINDNHTEVVIRAGLAAATTSFRKWCDSSPEGPELNDAISTLQDIIKIAEAAPSAVSKTLRSKVWLQKARFHEHRVLQLSERSDAEQALSCYQKSCELCPENWVARISSAHSLYYIFSVNGDRQTLEAFLQELYAIWDSIPQDDPTLVDLLLYTSIALYRRADFDGCCDDLDIALELLRVGSSLHCFPRRDLIFSLLSIGVLTARFEARQNMQDLERAEALTTEIFTKSELDPRHKTFEQEMLGAFYLARYKTFWRQDHWLDMFQHLSEGTYPQIRIEASWRFGRILYLNPVNKDGSSNLSTAYSFTLKALNFIQARKAEWPVQYVEAGVCFTLGQIQSRRFHRYNAVSLLEDSVSYFRSSALLTPRDGGAFGRRAAGVVSSLRIRAKHHLRTQAQQMADLTEAQFWIQKIILGPKPLRSSDHIEIILELGHFIRVAPRLGTESDRIEKAIRHYTRATELDCSEFHTRNNALWSLGEAWTDKGRISMSASDLKTALGFFDRVETFAQERGIRSRGLMPSLAALLHELYKVTGDIQYAARCTETSYKIFAESNYSNTSKLMAALRFAMMVGSLFLNPDLKKHMNEGPFARISFDQVFAVSLELVDEVLSENLTRPQQLAYMRLYHPYPLLCAYAGWILKREPRETVRAFERGRNVILTRLLNQRMPIEDLRKTLPELANRYQALKEQLRNPGADSLFTDQPRDKFEVESKLNDVLKEIRRQQGFQHFQRPYLNDDEIQDLSKNGPIIMLVAGSESPALGFAFIVGHGSVYCQDLPGYSQKECERQYNRLSLAVKNWQTSGDDDSVLHEVLSWLWYKVAEPILDRLGNRSGNIGEVGTELPRIWWILCDWANRLPIHAAGDHRKARDNGLPCTVMDRAISSYSPTLQSLKYSRNRLSVFSTGEVASQTTFPASRGHIAADNSKLLPSADRIEEQNSIKRPSGDAKPGFQDLQHQAPALTREADSGQDVELKYDTLNTPECVAIQSHDSLVSERNISLQREDIRAQREPLPIDETGRTVQGATIENIPLALLAAMPTTPDHDPLPNALSEIETVAANLAPTYAISSFSSPTWKDIVTGLQTCSIAHLACHSSAHSLDPLKSRLLLSDWGPKPLRVSNLMSMEMKNCQLAYLSACETAVNHDHKLAEEALHICGAFQMAGVPNVVATLWEIRDEEACTIAGDFYTGLKGLEDSVDVRNSARALHRVTMKARDAGMSPFIWAGYAHFGA